MQKKILISTGILPPKIGGPAQYAKHLSVEFGKRGCAVETRTYTTENFLPTGIRHLWYFCKVFPAVWRADAIISLDTFSVGFPTALACFVLQKKHYIRTGGDFLWEGYVERTKKKVLLRNFYHTEISHFSVKEGIIFNLTKWTLHHTEKVIFSTDWQRKIFLDPYSLILGKTAIIGNFLGERRFSDTPPSKEFVGSTRPLVWKNLDTLESVFYRVQNVHPEVKLFTQNVSYEKFMSVLGSARAVILVSLGDISPNMILDAIALGVPFICTKEVGIYEQIKDIGIFVDPLNEEEIEHAVIELLSDEGYRSAQEKVRSFSETHSWQQIGQEFLDIIQI